MSSPQKVLYPGDMFFLRESRIFFYYGSHMRWIQLGHGTPLFVLYTEPGKIWVLSSRGYGYINDSQREENFNKFRAIAFELFP